MSPDNTIRLLQRLHAASSASTQAYRRAAGTIDMTGFSTLFIEYAKDHARIASWVSRQIARVCRERHLEAPSLNTSTSQELDFLTTNDLYALLNICIKLQDTVVTVFAEAKDSALAAPLRRFIAREYEQLKWAREGLDRLRQERSNQARETRKNAMDQLRQLQSGRFEADSFAGLRPAT
jgi:hypothetical protein